MSAKAAFRALANVRVAGIPNNYSLFDLPYLIGREQLPCKITLLDDTFHTAAVPLGYEGSFSLLNLTASVTIALRFVPPGNPPDRMADALDFFDAWIAAFDENWTLGDTLGAPLTVETIHAGLVDWNGLVFVGMQSRIRLPVRV